MQNLQPLSGAAGVNLSEPDLAPSSVRQAVIEEIFARAAAHFEVCGRNRIEPRIAACLISAGFCSSSGMYEGGRRLSSTTEIISNVRDVVNNVDELDKRTIEHQLRILTSMGLLIDKGGQLSLSPIDRFDHKSPEFEILSGAFYVHLLTRKVVDSEPLDRVESSEVAVGGDETVEPVSPPQQPEATESKLDKTARRYLAKNLRVLEKLSSELESAIADPEEMVKTIKALEWCCTYRSKPHTSQEPVDFVLDGPEECQDILLKMAERYWKIWSEQRNVPPRNKLPKADNLERVPLTETIKEYQELKTLGAPPALYDVIDQELEKLDLALHRWAQVINTQIEQPILNSLSGLDYQATEVLRIIKALPGLGISVDSKIIEQCEEASENLRKVLNFEFRTGQHLVRETLGQTIEFIENGYTYVDPFQKAVEALKLAFSKSLSD